MKIQNGTLIINIVPLLYGNNDVVKITGNIKPPTTIDVVKVGWFETSKTITDSELEIGKIRGRNPYGAFNNNISEKIDNDFYHAQTTMANYATKNTVSQNVSDILATSMLPALTKGNYPIKAVYKLPGKNHITHTKQINIEY